MASLELDADGAQFTLAFFTSVWNHSVDTITLPRICVLLDSINAYCKKKPLIGLLKVCRTDSNVDRSNNVRAQRLDAAQYKVTDLPACVLIDAQGQTLTVESFKALESLYRQPQVSEKNKETSQIFDNLNSWKVLADLLECSYAPVAAFETLRPLWKIDVPVESANIPKRTEDNDPELVKMRENALKLFESGQYVASLSKFEDILLRCPTCTKSNFNIAVILQSIGETYFAVASMLRVVRLDDSDSVAHTVLRSVYFQEEPDLVITGYHSISKTHGDTHVRAVHSLATLTGATTTKMAAPAYVAKVFDELAESFEEKLVAHLEYRVPWQLVEALKQVSPPGFNHNNSTTEADWVVADVGCGTGLCGRLLRPYVKYLIGVDISPLMIEKTRDGGSYDELHTLDIVPFLKSCGDESLNLVIAADVWIYVGSLDQVFELSARKLQVSTGWMAFSIEILPFEDIKDDTTDSANFRLATSGRFQHSHNYIKFLAFQWGFNIIDQQDVAVRKESGEPVPGRIYLLQRSAPLKLNLLD
ncbi:cellulose synthase subunit [Plasmopara halstedii]|uniref:Cellulose synthase subunit n=1 Tax=Plasmopara halstedii TaxID=4781 RepID=A0A0P1AWM6_PLAHL|nr:cellulose synthase subunit [Plasmopara halstedii]CEG46781.1 cellulose synthase subunit [Plasmopara halstedii]|eukprot:XP_024583150.1 cellulose synthase subunit [Plasmopara halstedii]